LNSFQKPPSLPQAAPMARARRSGGGGTGRLSGTDKAELEALIARAALGDRAAFAALFDRTSAKLLGIALRVLKDRGAAEDAVQDAYVKIWRHADRFAATGHHPMAWMGTIARNAAIDALRRRPRGETGERPPESLAAPGPSPETLAIRGDESRRIVGCLDELDPDHRQAVIGAYLEGRTYADLAERYAIPLNTMRSWLRRALLSLQECMGR